MVFRTKWNKYSLFMHSIEFLWRYLHARTLFFIDKAFSKTYNMVYFNEENSKF